MARKRDYSTDDIFSSIDSAIGRKTTPQTKSKSTNTIISAIDNAITKEKPKPMVKYSEPIGPQKPIKSWAGDLPLGKAATIEAGPAKDKNLLFKLKEGVKDKVGALIGGFADTTTFGAYTKNEEKIAKKSGVPTDFLRNKEQNPKTFIAGQMAGYVMPGSVAEKGAGLVVKGAGLGSKVARGALAGSTLMGAESAIKGESAKEIGKNALLGGAFGAGGELAAAGIGKGLSKLKNVIKPNLINKVDDVVKASSEVAPTTEGNLAKKLKPLSEDTQRLVKEIDLDLDGATTKPTLINPDIAKNIKDGSGFKFFNQDVYRNFEDAFGKNYKTVKKAILDPLDTAKKSFVDMQSSELTALKKDIVDKLGIKKGSKESKLVQQFGEGLIPEMELKSKYPKVADKVIEADKWFRKQYDRLIDEINQARTEIYPNTEGKIATKNLESGAVVKTKDRGNFGKIVDFDNATKKYNVHFISKDGLEATVKYSPNELTIPNTSKLIPKRKDYYRHFQELSDSFAGIKNIFETPAQINPSLVGVSEFTKPKSKFLSFAQQRLGNKTKYDAVGGFLDYVKSASYAKHIDPQIPKFRQLAKDIALATDETRNANNFIGFLQDYANDLAGKTNPADRFIQDKIPGGRKTFGVINWINQKTKANTVLGNISSSLSQIANVPQGVAYVKNPTYLTKGANDTIMGILKPNKLYKESQFISERYSDKLYRQFDTKLIDQPRRLAEWMLGALDEVGTKFTWNSVYHKAVAEGIENPIKHADDITRSLVAGRGVGEVPLLQKSKITQLVAPFTLEVQNLWKVQKDFIKAKDFGGLIALYLGNYAINKGLEQVRGSGVTFDPLKALQDAFLSEEYKDKTAMQKVGRIAGEVISNMPLGSNIASAYPEYGNESLGLPTRKEFFGRTDPTRFGSGLLAAKGLADPLYSLAPNFGGKQIKKTIEGIRALNKGAVYAKGGDKIRYPIENNLSNKLKGALFGSSSFNESKDYYDNERRELSQQQTEKLNKEVSKGKDPKDLYNALIKYRDINKQKDKIQEEIKAKFPKKKDYLKQYETNKTLKNLNKKLKEKQFKWINQEND